MYKNTRHWIETLERSGELVRIREYVNPHLEIPEITDRVSKAYGPALLFENNGTSFPLLINSMGTEKRMAMALGVDRLDDIGGNIEGLLKKISTPRDNVIDKLKLLPTLGSVASWMPRVKNGRGECQEVVVSGEMLRSTGVNMFPVLKCWPEDGGPFFTLPIIHTRDPLTNIRNVGLYRMQVFGPQLTAMHWHRHKVSARHFAEYKNLGVKMPVAVALGGDPVYTYAATAPLPENIDEYMLAGFLRKRSVDLVRCLTQDVQVPADADIILEGYIDPAEELILEGPFGDHTGYYSLPDYYPRFHITCITHRKDAVYPATIVGIPPQEDAWIGKATERIFLVPIKMTTVPEIADMVLPVEGVFHNLVIVKIRKEYPGQAIKVMHSLWGAGQMMFTKMMIVVDGDVDIHDSKAVAQYVSEHTDPGRDIIFSRGPVDVLDHSCSVMAFGGKMGIDATRKLPEEKEGITAATSFEPAVQIPELLQQLAKDFPEIKDVNVSLLNKNISLVFVSVEKNRKGHIRELAGSLAARKEFSGVRFFIFLEHTVDVHDVADAVWRFSNNVDPGRDSILVHRPGGTAAMAFDGTRKTKALDGFERDWPNILASDAATMDRIDAIWDKLGLGPFMPSPSRKYSGQLYGSGAVAAEDHR